MNASIFFKSRRRPIHLDFRWNALSLGRVALAKRLNALETAALPPGIFCANKALEKLAFDDPRLAPGLRLRLAGYLGICRSPRSK